MPSPLFKRLLGRETTRRRTLLAVTAAVTVPLMLAGCSEGGATDGATGSGAPTSLVVGLSQNPETLDPGQTGLLGAVKVLGQIFDPLIYRFSGDKDYTPGLATSFSVNKDATVYTFKLREGVKFQDGTPFNADAVKATFDHIMDPATKSLTAKGLLGPYKESKVVDEHTVDVVFSAPYPAFSQVMSSATLGISSPTALKKYGADYATHPVGTGPFKLDSFTSNSEVKLSSNPDYTWGPKQYGDGPSKIKTIDFRILTDTTAQANALTTGEIQVADNLSPQDITSAKSSGKKVVSTPAAGMPYGYLINTDKAPTNDLAVRQAIMHAVDRASIIKTLFEGQYDLATSVATAATPGYVDGSANYTYDPALANKLLDQAGWVKGADGKRSKDGVPLTINMIDIANFGFDGMSPLIQAQLAKVGITAKLSNQAFPTVATSYNQGASNTSSWFYWSTDPNMIKTVFMCDQIKSGFNWAHYCDKSLDAQILKADQTQDPTARLAGFSDVFKQLDKAAAFLPIYDLKVILATNGIDDIPVTVDAIPLYAGLGR